MSEAPPGVFKPPLLKRAAARVVGFGAPKGEPRSADISPKGPASPTKEPRPEVKIAARGDGIEYKDLSQAVKESLTEAEYDLVVKEYVSYKAAEDAKLSTYGERLHRKEDLLGEGRLEHRPLRRDEPTGTDFAFYTFNEGKSGPPLVVKLGWSWPVDSRGGRELLKELAQRVDRPIIAYDSWGTGKTSVPKGGWRKNLNFNTMAASEARVLDQELAQLGYAGAQFDILGISMNGIVAEKVAAIFGPRARHLLTVSMPGLEKVRPDTFAQGFKNDLEGGIQAAKELPDELQEQMKRDSAFYEEIYNKLGVDIDPKKLPGFYKAIGYVVNSIEPLRKLVTADMPPESFNNENIPTLLKQVFLMSRAAARDIPTALHPETQWSPMVGSADSTTSVSAHLDAVRKRNEIAQSAIQRSNSDLHILGAETHHWISSAAPKVAEHVAGLLGKEEAKRIRREKIRPAERKVVMTTKTKVIPIGERAAKKNFRPLDLPEVA